MMADPDGPFFGCPTPTPSPPAAAAAAIGFRGLMRESCTLLRPSSTTRGPMTTTRATRCCCAALSKPCDALLPPMMMVLCVVISALSSTVHDDSGQILSDPNKRRSLCYFPLLWCALVLMMLRPRRYQARVPSWTDRVLWKCNPATHPGSVRLLHYSSVPEMRESDHR